MVVEDTGQPDAVAPWAIQHPAQELPSETLHFLLASRYCEVDRLMEVAWGLFKGAPAGWGRVQAVCDWVHNNIRFDHQAARPTKTAYDVFVDRAGVCRDFAHLALTFCRCLCIPARYATGYLGDIGVPPMACPMDFSGWFEVYLGGRWYTFDARHNVPRIGRVLMARARRGRRGHDDLVRQEHPRAFHGLDGRGDGLIRWPEISFPFDPGTQPPSPPYTFRGDGSDARRPTRINGQMWKNGKRPIAFAPWRRTMKVLEGSRRKDRDFPVKLSDDWMKSNSAVPRGSLVSKPTWSNTSGYSATSAFFLS